MNMLYYPGLIPIFFGNARIVNRVHIGGPIMKNQSTSLTRGDALSFAKLLKSSSRELGIKGHILKPSKSKKTTK